MLRAKQTIALSDKISRMFDTIDPQVKKETQPLIVKMKWPTNDRASAVQSRFLKARRRRARRNRLVAASSSFRVTFA